MSPPDAIRKEGVLISHEMSHVLSEQAEWPNQGASDFGELYREHVDYVWRVLSHLGVKPADVADVCQDVFLTVRKRLDSFEGRSSLRTWIYGICIRVASDYRSRAFRRREIPHEDVPDTKTEATQGESVEQAQLRQRLARLLSELKPDQREVFVLYEVEELTMREVAEVVDCPLQTAYSRLHAARDALRTKLEKEGVRP